MSPGSAVPPPVTAVLDASQRWLPARLGEVEERLRESISGWGGPLGEDAGDTLAAGGKRLRPMLVLLCAGEAGGAAAVRAATAIELVHMATLVHDDVLDEAPLRRGLPTVAATSGRARALATGDLLLSRSFDEMMADVIDAKDVGRGVIDGVECEHLAFRNTDTDWQIWIELGARPIPHKYVITTKATTGMPQYTLRIKEWRSDVAADAFAFKSAEGAKKVGLEALADTDEVPPGTVTGEKK